MKRIVAPLMILLGIIVLIGLGLWQLQRLEWKENLIADIARHQSENVDLTSYVQDPAAEFRRGEITGKWDAARTFKTHNITMDSNFGYWIVTPLKLEDGTVLMVNRGWVQDGQQDRVLGRVLSNGKTTVLGTLRRAGKLAGEPQMDGYTNPWVLFMERSAPADHPELIPAPVSVAMPNDHKQYAIFWFTMAGVLAAFGIFSLLKGRSASSPNP